ncbi:hypothetical protein NIES4075_51240 [Tolypothrix sp. NIES-4075]|uniref:hypothetical protein n=1 Tax=Tolypothrix sp. NIES-4075 TaxID=2005459 RepID=UPI000B5C6BA5|nr:hypothetical protein [Tolypothrix sp. NIES-4075]GAX44107.1 hypothetical protein NIES4075_51240 [Tolypothrix sp. NIES-4075]
MGNGEWVMGNREWVMRKSPHQFPIPNYPFGVQRLCFKSAEPTAGARLPGNPSNALPPQRTGSPITNFQLPIANSQFSIPN